MAESDPKRVVEAGSTEPNPMHVAVDRMAELMKLELDANAAKKGVRKDWLLVGPMMHVLQTYYHTGKLQVALRKLQDLKNNDEASRSAIEHSLAEVKEFAADVANHALMVLDVLGLLGMPDRQPQAEKKVRPKKKRKKSLPDILEEIATAQKAKAGKELDFDSDPY